MNRRHLKPLFDLIKTLRKNSLKKAIRSDCSYIKGGNLTSLQLVIEKSLDQFAICSYEKDCFINSLWVAVVSKRFIAA